MELLNKTLYWISTGMLLPVIIGLLYLFIRSLAHTGGFLGLAVNRIKHYSPFKKKVNKVNTPAECRELVKELSGNLEFFDYLKKMVQPGATSLEIAKLIADYELYGEKECDKSKVLLRTGPMLGLMGTLIPMGPALSGLASGQLDMMAQQMRLAFSTTVIGVFCGIIGYLINMIKQRWYAEDRVNFNYIAEVLDHEAQSK